MKTILGIDEVGRGPWAGPLVVGACILSPRFDNSGKLYESETWQKALTDSKKLTPKKREKLAPEIKEKSKAYGLGWVSANELDEIGLAEALKLATRRAVLEILKMTNQKFALDSLDKNPPKNLPFSEIIIDGTQNFLKGTALENLVSVLPKADLKIKEVSAASIIAKVARDEYMKNLSEKYPNYGFESHVGYGTKKHKQALENFGPCQEHRFSFRPIADVNLDSAKTSTNTTAIGQKAEKIVAEYLKSHEHHTILVRNYKTKIYEIDIVSANKDHIYFTEVKYRKNHSRGDPLENITKEKRQRMVFAAELFMKTLAEKLHRELKTLPSPILAAASVSGENYKLERWFEITE